MTARSRSSTGGARAPDAAPRAAPARSVRTRTVPTRSVPTDSEIHARLFDALLDQRLAPGSRLREDELARAFGVSRTRIRQVLIRLASEQLVTLVPHAGARVAEPTPEDAREVFAARRLIEPALLAGFVDRAGAADLRALRRWIVDEEQARAHGQRNEAIRMAGGFHLHIAEHAGNATLARMMRELVSRTSLVLMCYGPSDVRETAHNGGGCDCHEHRQILEALRQRDKPAAMRAMQQHLARLEGQLVFQEAARPVQGLAEILGL